MNADSAAIKISPRNDNLLPTYQPSQNAEVYEDGIIDILAILITYLDGVPRLEVSLPDGTINIHSIDYLPSIKSLNYSKAYNCGRL